MNAGKRGIADWSPGQSVLSWVSSLRISTVFMTKRTIGLFIIATSFIGYSDLSLAVTPYNMAITNTASANYLVGALPLVSQGSVTVTTAGATPSTIEFLQFAPNGGSSVNVSATQCGGNSINSVNVIGPPNTSLTFPAAPASSSVSLVPASQYAIGDTVFIRVSAYDQNKSATAIDTIVITVTTPAGDTETLTLSETGLSTGVFVGYIQSSTAAVAANNCTLNVARNQTATAHFIDPLSNIAVSASGLFDPFGKVFDSNSGLGVNGASVTLINTANNLPTTVFCDDGVTTLPLPITSGNSTSCDAIVAQGSFRFPRVSPGSYKIVINPPTNYSSPCGATVAALQALPGGPFAVTTQASFGQAFTLSAGPPLKIDVPIDPVSSGGLIINKTAGKSTVGEGEFVPYVLTIQNSGVNTASNVKIGDLLPFGFRYTKNSARVNTIAIAEPIISSDGRMLNFSIGNVAGGATVTLKYVATVTVAAKVGNAENIAYSTSHNSNTGRANITVTEDLFKSRAILAGTVFACDCDEIDEISNADTNKEKLIGVKGVRIVLEDGTYINTDNNGHWHAENIRPGTHVVQLDLDSIAGKYEIINKGNNTRFAGRNYSQFVNLQAGTLWRADFYLRKIKSTPTVLDAVSAAALTTTTTINNPADEKVTVAENNTTPAEKATESVSNRMVIGAAAFVPTKSNAGPQLVEKLPYNTDWLATVQPGIEWLHPQASFQAALPAIKVAIKTLPGQKIALKINGQDANPLNYDGVVQNTAKTVSLSTWSGVIINEGDNKLEVTITDIDGKAVLLETRMIHFSSGPIKAVFVPEKSRLSADGKTKPILAIRFLDKDNKPARRGMIGSYQLNTPYESASLHELMQRTKLLTTLNNNPTYEIGDDGVTLIELAPTTQTGEVIMNFEFSQQHKQEIRTWLTPGQRDWILVGFGQGTIGHKELSGNVQALKDAGVDDQLFDQNQLAFYAKGTVKGEYLITAAYDTAKQSGSSGSIANLKQVIDPNRYYTLYADATQPYYDAASASKLYIKVERKQFYAMFGDFDTGLTVTELSRYSRTVNGIKSEFKSDKFGYNAFATQTNQGYIHDEIPGEGTSGLYHLSRKSIIENTDKIRIDVRDRFQSQVIVSSTTLTRFLDYDIDYILGTVFFKSPIMSRDENLNPTFIIAEYEASDTKDNKLTYGGRASYKPDAKTEIGATLIHEGNVGASGNLHGVDLQYQINDKTKLKAEIATSNKDISGTATNSSAYLAEVVHYSENLNAKAYIRQQDNGFGLGQQAGSETGTRKIGAESRLHLSQSLDLQGEAYTQDNLDTGAKREVVNARVIQKQGDLTTYYGGRVVKDMDSTGVNRDSNQVIAGVKYEMNKQLALRASTELGIGASNSTDFPDRITLGADYKLSEITTAFAEHEFARGDSFTADTTRIGIRTKPWTGAEVTSSLGSQTASDGDRTFANLGLVQKWQINEHWQSDFGLERSQTIVGSQSTTNNAITNGNVNAFNTNVPLASGNASGNSTGDFTAVSTGVSYTNSEFSTNARIEVRNSATDDKVNLVLGAARALKNGESMAAGLIYNDTSSTSGSTSGKFDARLSYALRPLLSSWIMLDRLDLINEKLNDTVTTSRTLKLVNNLNLNYMPNRRTQLSLEYGSKFVLDAIDNTDYRGYTDLTAAELRYDLTSNCDIGVHGSVLNSWSSNVHLIGAGASAGYRIMDNSWLSVGYNFMGFNDKDFGAAEYRAKGVYATIRVKFDQDTLKLNDKKKQILSIAPL